MDPVPSATVREVYATPTMKLSKVTGLTRLQHRRDFAEHLASSDLSSPITAQLSLYGATHVAGTWVLSDAFSMERALAAYAAGAVGLLVPRGVDLAGWMPKMIAGPTPAPLPVMCLRSDLHRQLAAHAQFADVSVKASVPLRSVAVAGVNVYGVFAEPSGGAASILLTAHFDGVGDDPDARFPAACDNASGVAVVIEAARLMAPSLPAGIGLSVALLDGEEVGARGSAHHAPQVRPRTFVINVDGAAQLGDAASVEAGGPAHALLHALDQAGRDTGVPLVAGAMPSDNRRYAAEGLPTVGIGMGMPGYQTPAETPDRVDVNTLSAAVRLVVASVAQLVLTGVGRRFNDKPDLTNV
jgi:aminopeptidase YwaD